MFSLFPSLIFSLPFADPACFCFPGLGTPYSSFLGAPASPGCLLNYFVCFFYLFFCLECLSLQDFVAERTHFQWIKCKFHLPLGNYTTLFWEVLQCRFLFVAVVYHVFLFYFIFFFTFFSFIWREWEDVGKKVGAGFCLFFKTHLQEMVFL